jgi:hypothetical protein
MSCGNALIVRFAGVMVVQCCDLLQLPFLPPENWVECSWLVGVVECGPLRDWCEALQLPVLQPENRVRFAWLVGVLRVWVSIVRALRDWGAAAALPVA